MILTWSFIAVIRFFTENNEMITNPNPVSGKSDTQAIETEVLVIGGGVTGAGVMRDLALRGVRSILVDKSDLCAGASGGNHGLLHSGARYVQSDPPAAIECRRESDILKRIAPNCIEETGGMFVAADGDDQTFGEKFPELCEMAGIRCTEISPEQACQLEPHLATDIRRVYLVPDATVDPFRLALENVKPSSEASREVTFSDSL